MEFDFDQQQIFYSVGAFFAVAASTYLLGTQISLSVLTKSMLLFLAFAGFTVAAQMLEGKEIKLITSGLSGVSAIIFVTYTVFRFELNPPVVLLALAVSAVIFMVAGYNLERLKGYEWPLNTRQALAGIAVLALVFVGVDAATSDLDESYDWKDSVNVSMDDEFVLGEVTVSNNFYLPRRVDTASFDGCIYAPERKSLYVREEYDSDLLWKGSRTLEITGRASVRPDSNVTIEGEYPVEIVEADECPENVSERKILIFPSGDSSGYGIGTAP
ncbi:hypothetical protein [Candidatus Nanohalovita haloferacivicina]|uniref:hypothetical protein n=1 Tax=Candidatus Nanohalovita haloferacivicina TaxID=2978046 RepID=UPI00325FAD50|nr:putative membrane protein [Candidatus Nanohalobia archaeon BNXNv]